MTSLAKAREGHISGGRPTAFVPAGNDASVEFGHRTASWHKRYGGGARRHWRHACGLGGV